MGTRLQICLLIIPFLFLSFSVKADPSEYTRLIFKLENKKNKDQEPLYLFSTVEDDTDTDIHQQNLNYFNRHPELIRKIQADLGCKQLDWQLTSTRQRLLFVPEKQGEFARLYKNYCIQAINHILIQTGFANPYEEILMLQQAKPRLHPRGYRAYLVQNLVREVVSTYLFSSPQNRSIMLELNNKIWLGEVGSFSSHLQIKGDEDPVFIHNNYTIWQTSAKNPFTALTVPVEETLHILLRDYTHNAVKQELQQRRGKGIPVNLKRLVDDWIAVEEALVGGLIHALLPPFLQVQGDTSVTADTLLADDRQTRENFHQYRYLEKGVAIVKTIGVHEAIRCYKVNPRRFRELLISSEMKKKAGAGRSPSPAFCLTLRLKDLTLSDQQVFP